MKNVKLILFVIVTASIFYACTKINQTDKALQKSSSAFSSTAANCSSPQRYRDTVFNDAQIRITRNIVYRNSSDYMQTDSVKTTLLYDDYDPIDSDTTILRPLIILLHGGGFTYHAPPYENTRIDMDYAARRFARYGYCVASIEFRIDPNLEDTLNYFTPGSNVFYKVLYRTIQDTRFAIRLAKGNASAAKIDTNNIFVGGVSSGGIIALHVAYLDDNEVPSSMINVNELGLLDYGGNLQNSSKIRGAFAYAGGLTGLEMVATGNIPALNIMSKKDNFFPYECGIDYTYRRVYICGAKAVSEKLQSLNIPQSLLLLDDNEINVPDPIPGNFLSHSHGSVFKNAFYQRRDVDSTISFLYRTFHPAPCL